MRTSGIAAAVALCSLAAAHRAAAADPPLATLRAGESVRIALGHDGDRRIVAFAGVEGATLDIEAAARGKSKVLPQLTLVGPGGRVIDIGGGNPTGGRRARVRGFSIPETGVWRIGVSTPMGRGGDAVLAVRGRRTRHLAWTDRERVGIGKTYEFPAAPGDRVRVSVSRPEAKAPTAVRLLGPGGELVEEAVGTAGRLAIAVTAPALADYRVRVETGPGEVVTRVTVRGPRPGRPRFEDVEAPPEILGFTPGTVSNQATLTFRLDGVEFAERQVVSILDGDRVVASAPLIVLGGSMASALLHLEAAPPGTYVLVVSTPGGNAVAAREPVVVTNRPPSVISSSPSEALHAAPFAVDVTGTGFDTDATVRVRRRSDGALAPVVVTKRSGSERIEALVSPPVHFTGPCDLEVVDPDGASAAAPGGLDLLGQRAAPVAFRSLDGAPPLDLTALAAAWDAKRGRVLAAAREGGDRAVLTLLDANGFASADALEIRAGDLGAAALQHVRVAADRDGTSFAIAVTSQSDPPAARVLVVAADDLGRTLGTFDVPAEDLLYVTRLDVTADRARGGFLALWDRHDATWGGRLLAQPIGADGAVDPARRAVLAWAPLDDLAYPAAASRPDGRFVVAWAGGSDDGAAYAIRATVVDGGLAQVPGAGPYTAASSRSWNFAAAPDLAVDPRDGTAALTFAFGEGAILRPASQRLAAGDAYPGAWHPLDAGLRFDGGQPGGVVWDPARRGFVATVVGHDRRVSVRRLGGDGAVLAHVVETYEGLSAVPFAGPLEGSLGLLRGFDGIADDRQEPQASSMRLVAAPLR